MDSTYFAKLIGVTLLGIALIISAYKKVLVSISLIVIGIAFIILMNNIN